MPEYACIACGVPTEHPSKRCTQHRAGTRPRGNAFEPVRQAIFVRDEGHCQDCGVELTQAPGQTNSFHVGHRHARGIGGSDQMDNLQAECAECNLRKGQVGAAG